MHLLLSSVLGLLCVGHALSASISKSAAQSAEASVTTAQADGEFQPFGAQPVQGYGGYGNNNYGGGGLLGAGLPYGGGNFQVNPNQQFGNEGLFAPPSAGVLPGSYGQPSAYGEGENNQDAYGSFNRETYSNNDAWGPLPNTYAPNQPFNPNQPTDWNNNNANTNNRNNRDNNNDNNRINEPNMFGNSNFNRFLPFNQGGFPQQPGFGPDFFPGVMGGPMLRQSGFFGGPQPGMFGGPQSGMFGGPQGGMFGIPQEGMYGNRNFGRGQGSGTQGTNNNNNRGVVRGNPSTAVNTADSNLRGTDGNFGFPQGGFNSGYPNMMPGALGRPMLGLDGVNEQESAAVSENSATTGGVMASEK